ncbi:MAG: adenosine kinase [Bacteroidales bacterium]|nr:adenosine kinase [Bacteroidales bacterium]
MRVLGMGNALVDILAKLESDDSLQVMGLPKGSMQLINEDELLKILDSIKIFDTYHASGGSAGNAVRGLAELGVHAGFIGKTGSDYYGKFYEEDLRKSHVVPHLLEDTLASGCAMGMISPDGERTFATYLGAASNLQAEDLSEEMFAGYEYFHIEGYLVQNPELIRKACRLAKAAGSKISLDMASYNIVESNHDFFKELLTEYTDIVFANEEEAYAYTQAEPEEAVKMLGALCEIAIVKVGSKGSLIMRGDEIAVVGVDKYKCLDTTGAGDLYAAGFLYGLIHKQSLEICGKIGSILAGNVIEIMGTKMEKDRWNKIKTLVHSLTAN